MDWIEYFNKKAIVRPVKYLGKLAARTMHSNGCKVIFRPMRLCNKLAMRGMGYDRSDPTQKNAAKPYKDSGKLHFRTLTRYGLVNTCHCWQCVNQCDGVEGIYVPEEEGWPPAVNRKGTLKVQFTNFADTCSEDMLGNAWINVTACTCATIPGIHSPTYCSVSTWYADDCEEDVASCYPYVDPGGESPWGEWIIDPAPPTNTWFAEIGGKDVPCPIPGKVEAFAWLVYIGVTPSCYYFTGEENEKPEFAFFQVHVYTEVYWKHTMSDLDGVPRCLAYTCQPFIGCTNPFPVQGLCGDIGDMPPIQTDLVGCMGGSPLTGTAERVGQHLCTATVEVSE